MEIDNQIAIRLSFFFGIFIWMTIWELVAPRRFLSTSKTVRWLSNLRIIFLDTGAVRLLFPILPVALALLAQRNGWGLLNNLDLRHWLEAVAGVIALDLVIYLQHVMFHAAPALWRLHMMHHAGLDIDVATGLRFRFTASRAKVNLGRGPDFVAWTYNGQIPGPEIRVREAERIRVYLENRLADSQPGARAARGWRTPLRQAWKLPLLESDNREKEASKD